MIFLLFVEYLKICAKNNSFKIKFSRLYQKIIKKFICNDISTFEDLK